MTQALTTSKVLAPCLASQELLPGDYIMWRGVGEIGVYILDRPCSPARMPGLTLPQSLLPAVEDVDGSLSCHFPVSTMLSMCTGLVLNPFTVPSSFQVSSPSLWSLCRCVSFLSLRCG